MTRPFPIPFSLLLLVFLLALPQTVQADIYRYVDANGVVHFTNRPTAGQFRFFKKERGSQPAKSGSIDELIHHYSSAYNLETSLVRAVIKVESNYNPHAVSNKGAQGLMQLIPETARDMKVADPFNPADNIRGGSRYLRLMLDEFGGRLDLALAAYNAGPGAVKRYGGIPPFEETRNYVEKVKKYLYHYRQNPSS